MSELTKNSYRLPNLELINLLGKGGMSTVWRARQLSLDRYVAVKILAQDFCSSQEDIDRFLQEARACARLHHSGIVRVYDANYSDGIYYIVMELIDGYTMGEWLRRKAQLPVEDALIILESVAYALDYAWRSFRIVHCDIKPDNIMIDADGTIKITDLGLSRSILAMHPDVEDEVIGTPAYISPEQAYGEKELDCRSDIYSLGATIYHLLTGRVLFDGQTVTAMMESHVGDPQAPDPREFAPHIQEGLIFLLERMLAKRRENRYPDWEDLLRDIARIYEGRRPPRLLMPKPGSSMSVRK